MAIGLLLLLSIGLVTTSSFFTFCHTSSLAFPNCILENTHRNYQKHLFDPFIYHNSSKFTYFNNSHIKTRQMNIVLGTGTFSAFEKVFVTNVPLNKNSFSIVKQFRELKSIKSNRFVISRLSVSCVNCLI